MSSVPSTGISTSSSPRATPPAEANFLLESLDEVEHVRAIIGTMLRDRAAVRALADGRRLVEADDIRSVTPATLLEVLRSLDAQEGS